MGSINTRAVCTAPSFAIALSRLDKVQHRTKKWSVVKKM